MVRVCRALRDLGVEPRGIYGDEKVLNGVLIVDEGGRRFVEELGILVNGSTLTTGSNDDPLCVAIRAIAASRGVAKGSPLVVGIDLGDRIGIAMLMGREVIFAKSSRSHVRILELLHASLTCIESARKIVRIGIPRKECPEYEKLIEAIVRSTGDDVELELVPEARSSKRVALVEKGRKVGRDERAAINIALARFDAGL